MNYYNQMASTENEIRRTGTILSFNKTAGIGLIEDLNHERIKFFGSDKKSPPSRGEQISFEIDFRNKSLVATNIGIFENEE